MNAKKTLQTVVVWYNPTTNKVSFAKCRKTGKFVSLSVAQGLLNAEINSSRMPIVKVDYSFLAMLMLLVCLAVAFGLPVGLIAAKITGNENMLIEYISFVKAAFVAWFISIIVLASAGNK